MNDPLLHATTIEMRGRRPTPSIPHGERARALAARIRSAHPTHLEFLLREEFEEVFADGVRKAGDV